MSFRIYFKKQDRKSGERKTNATKSRETELADAKQTKFHEAADRKV